MEKNYLAERGFLEFLSADTDSPKPFCSRASGSMYNGAFPWKRPKKYLHQFLNILASHTLIIDNNSHVHFHQIIRK